MGSRYRCRTWPQVQWNAVSRPCACGIKEISLHCNELSIVTPMRAWEQKKRGPLGPHGSHTICTLATNTSFARAGLSSLALALRNGAGAGRWGTINGDCRNDLRQPFSLFL